MDTNQLSNNQEDATQKAVTVTNFASDHDLRRAFGNRRAARLMPADLKQLMRHVDISTTMKFYITQQAKGL